MQLERLARTYWRFLTRVTLGLIRVDYGDAQRTVVLVRQPLRLLRFKAPEYAMDASAASCAGGSTTGCSSSGAATTATATCRSRCGGCADDPAPGTATIRVEVEVANFYPSIARRLSAPVYRATQSRIHVLITHGFLRSLRRLDLAESKVGRFAGRDVAGA